MTARVQQAADLARALSAVSRAASARLARERAGVTAAEAGLATLAAEQSARRLAAHDTAVEPAVLARALPAWQSLHFARRMALNAALARARAAEARALAEARRAFGRAEAAKALLAALR